MRWLIYPVVFLWGISSYVIFGVLGTLIGYVVLPVFTAQYRDPVERVRRGQLLLSRMCRMWIAYMTLGGLVRLRTGHLPRIEPGRPSMVIANHPTLLDIIMLIAAVPHITFLAKASYYNSRFVGPLLRFGRHICAPIGGRTEDPVDGATVLQEIINRLDEGFPVMVFPEGTRSPAGGLGPFRRGAFEAARRAGVPLHCLLIEAKPPWLYKGQPFWHVPSRRIRYHIGLLSTEHPSESSQNTRVLRRQIRSAYARALSLQEGPSPADGGAPGG